LILDDEYGTHPKAEHPMICSRTQILLSKPISGILTWKLTDMKRIEFLLLGLFLASLSTLHCGLLDDDSSSDSDSGSVADTGPPHENRESNAGEDNKDMHLVNRQGDHGFVGSVDGTEAFISIVTGFEVAMVLVVHGDGEIYESFEVDLPEDYSLIFENAVGAGISATYLDDEYSGDITLGNGNTHSFTASVIEGDVAGMFRIVREDCEQAGVEAAWIIDGAGAQRGAARVQARFLDTPVLDADKVTIGQTDYPVYKAGPPIEKNGGDGVGTGFPDVCKTPAPAGPVVIPYPG
jgi:hypothetical protein